MDDPQFSYSSRRQGPAAAGVHLEAPTLVRQFDHLESAPRYSDQVLYYLRDHALMAETLYGEVIWSCALEAAQVATTTLGLALGGDYAFVALSDGLHVIRKADGVLVNHLPYGYINLSMAVVNEDTIIFTCGLEGKLFLRGIRLDSLEMQFEVPVDHHLPHLAGDQEVVIGALGQFAWGFDARTGVQLWASDLKDVGLEPGHVEVGGPGEHPMLIGNLVVFPANNHTFVALDKCTGEEVWRTKVASRAVEGRSSMDAAGNIHVLSFHYSCIDSTQGRLLQEHPLRKLIISNDLGIIERHVFLLGKLYFGATREAKLYRFDIATQAIDWSASLPGHVIGHPMLIDKHLMVFVEGGSCCLFRVLEG